MFGASGRKVLLNIPNQEAVSIVNTGRRIFDRAARCKVSYRNLVVGCRHLAVSIRIRQHTDPGDGMTRVPRYHQYG